MTESYTYSDNQINPNTVCQEKQLVFEFLYKQREYEK